MASPVEIIFEGGGSLIDDLKTLAKASGELAVVHRKAHDGIQGDLKKSSDEALALGKDMEVASKTVVVLGKEASKSAKATSDAVAASRRQAAQLISDNAKLTEAQKKQAAAAGGITKEYEEIAIAASKAKAQQVAAFEEPLGLLDQIQARLELLGQKKLVLTDEAEIARTNDEMEALQAQFDAINRSTTETVATTRSLREQIKAAQDQAIQARAKFGDLSPEFRDAAQEVARLKKELSDVQQRVQALDPGDRVRAFSQLGNAIAGGAQAVSGFAIALGGNNEELQTSIFKFQSILFAVQGAQTFLKDFSDSLANVRALLGLTTRAQVANTAATEASTVASGKNAAAKGVQTTATVATTTATSGLTTALAALDTALAANPIGIVVAALATVAATFYILAKGEEEAVVNAEKLLDRLQRLSEVQLDDADMAKRLDLLESERLAIKDRDDAEARRAKLVRDRAAEEFALADRQAILDKERKEAAKVVNEILAEQDRVGVNEDNLERLKFAIEREKELSAEVVSIGRERAIAEKETANQIAAFDKQTKQEQIEREKQLAKDTLAIKEQLADDIVAIEKEIADRIQQLELSGADPRDRLELEKEIADEEIAVLEDNLKRTMALEKLRVQIGTNAFNALTEAQRKARAQAIVDAGGVDLSLKQQEQLNNLRLLNEQDFQKKLADVLAEEAATKAEILLAGQEREAAQFELDLAKRLEQLRAAKVSEREIEAVAARERAEFARTNALKSIDIDEQLRIAGVQARERAGEVEKLFEREKQEAILAIRIDAAEKKLALIQEDDTKERALERAQLQALINDLKTQAQQLKDNPVDINLLDLLGVAPEDQQQVKDAMQQVMQSAQQIASSIVAAQQAEVQARIEATDAIIADRRRRIDDLEGQLEEELSLQREGLANNADAVREEIKLRKEQEAQAIADKKRAFEEQKRLAKQQIAIDAASQISSLIASGANLIKTWSSLPYGVGIALAFAQIAAMVAAFASVRARINAVNRQQPTFRKGGRLGGLLEGPSHEAGGIAMIDRRTGREVGEAEGKEFLVNTRSYRKRKGLVEAINADDIGAMQAEAVRLLLESAGVRVQQPTVDRLRRQTIMASGGDAARARDTALPLLIEEVRGLREDVMGFKRQEREREREAVDRDGARVISRPQHRTVKR